MHNLNLGILAHVDAGKTSLTERLLFAAGVIDKVGRVDGGDTQTDSLDLERERGITIRSAVVAFTIGDLNINLVDTPGHSDFIAEVERALSVLDGAVLVVSAVEGVQAQTRVLMRALQRLRIPTLIFVNKIDRMGADPGWVVDEIRQKLGLSLYPYGLVENAGQRSATVEAWRSAADIKEGDIDQLADLDDLFLQELLNRKSAPPLTSVDEAVKRQTHLCRIVPVLFGSAVTGAGWDELITRLPLLAPSSEPSGEEVSGIVFKIEHGHGGRVAIVRVLEGHLRVRENVRIRGIEQRVTGLRVFENGTTKSVDHVGAGQMAQVAGLTDARIGDYIGAPPNREMHRFNPPTLETIVTCANGDRSALHVALSQLTEQDPLIGLRIDELRNELALSLYGEVQKEVIAETVVREFGITTLQFAKTTTICIERVAGVGSALEVDPQPFLGTISLRIEPGSLNSGISFRLEVEYGSIPLSFHKAVEESVAEVLHQGLAGWEVSDCVVTMTHSGYWPRQSHAHAKFDKSMSSTAGDFRLLTPLVLMSALKEAGTIVCEPIHRFRAEVPTNCASAVVNQLYRSGGTVDMQTVDGSETLLEGNLPAESVNEIQTALPSMSNGEGVWESTFETYRPVIGPVPSRERRDLNPLNRIEYLRNVALLR